MDAKQSRGAYREFTLDSIFSEDVTMPEAKIIWRTKPVARGGVPDPQCEELIQIASGGINIVSSREVRKNVRQSLRIGLDLASQGMRVLYVNSYAGIGLLQENLNKELARLESLTPTLSQKER